MLKSIIYSSIIILSIQSLFECSAVGLKQKRNHTLRVLRNESNWNSQEPRIGLGICLNKFLPAYTKFELMFNLNIDPFQNTTVFVNRTLEFKGNDTNIPKYVSTANLNLTFSECLVYCCNQSQCNNFKINSHLILSLFNSEIKNI